MRFAALLVALGLFVRSNLAFAQNLIFGSLSGTLTDSAGAVIPDAGVTLINEGTQDRRRVSTDSFSPANSLTLGRTACSRLP